MNNIEEWRCIIGYNGNYEISNFGGIRSCFNGVERNLKYLLNSIGYYTCGLSNNGKTKSLYIHRLVAIHFISNPESKRTVNHIDGNRLNNKVDNLEWNTDRENNCHRIIGKNKASKFVGVYLDKNNHWYSQIYFNGKNKHLGYFQNEQDAYQARVNFEKENNIQNKYL